MYLIPGRFADGIPPAAGFVAVGCTGGFSVHAWNAIRWTASGPLGDFRSRQPHWLMRGPEYRTPEGYREQAPLESRRQVRMMPMTTCQIISRAASPRARGLRIQICDRSRANRRIGSASTAICVEPRHGTLHIFMPPVRHTEDYLDLVASGRNGRGTEHAHRD